MTKTPTPAPGFDQALVDRAEFEKIAIWLPQYAVHHFNAGQAVIDGKTFTDCVIEGPALLMATDNVVFEDCNMGFATDPKSLLMQPVGPMVVGAVPFSNTRFVRCRFAMVSFTGHPDFIAQTAETLLRASEMKGDAQ
ncbi:MAG: hypothetical protein ACOH1H_14340 [Brevundimonas sp.]|jgi:hypothetical protein